MSEVELDEKGNIIIKVILVGDSGVGKTSLIKVVNNENFDNNQESTSEFSFRQKKMQIGNQGYSLNLWDTIGQEKLRVLTKQFFRESKIVIFVYDITSEISFKDLKIWEKDVKDTLGDSIIKGVVGNKNDLFLDEKVSQEKGIEYAKEINAQFKLVSAKTDPKAFDNMLQDLLKAYVNKEKGNDITYRDNKKLKKISVEVNKKKKCC